MKRGASDDEDELTRQLVSFLPLPSFQSLPSLARQLVPVLRPLLHPARYSTMFSR